MHGLAKLREPVDAFFDHVTVNANNKDLRLNRLRLLNELRVVILGVADFGKVAGDGVRSVSRHSCWGGESPHPTLLTQGPPSPTVGRRERPCNLNF